MIAKLEWTLSNAKQNKGKKELPQTMGSISNNRPTTTEPPP